MRKGVKEKSHREQRERRGAALGATATRSGLHRNLEGVSTGAGVGDGECGVGAESDRCDRSRNFVPGAAAGASGSPTSPAL